MELIINDVELPEKISFNYEELKRELAEKVHMYETIIYTDDQIKEAKQDKAALNKLKKALNDERIRREKEYMRPFNEFKAQINEIIAIIDKPVSVIDKQVKEYEEKKRQEKLDEIVHYWNILIDHPQWLRLDMIMSDKWLNASVSMKSVQGEIEARLEQIKSDLDTLNSLPEFSFEATEVYKTSLSLNKAVEEGKRLADIQRRKQEQEAAKAEAKLLEAEKEKERNTGVQEAVTGDLLDEPEAVAQWISFRARLTVAQAVELKDFFNRRGIEFEAI